MNSSNVEWEKEFDREFENPVLDITVHPMVKKFIRSTVAQAKKEAVESFAEKAIKMLQGTTDYRLTRYDIQALLERWKDEK